jgi:hypothetical protein
VSDESLAILERACLSDPHDLRAHAAWQVAKQRVGPKPGWRPMLPLEVIAARALGSCSFAPATSSKRIAQKIRSQTRFACNGSCAPIAPFHGSCMEWTGKITDKQAAVMWRLLWTFRRSVEDPELVELARVISGKP